MKHNVRKPNLTKQKASPPMTNELAMQNMIRKRYCDNWPDTILQLTKRVQAVNSSWASITDKVCRIDGCRISYYREKDDFVVEVRIADEFERHAITLQELIEARQYVEVIVMDKLSDSKLIAKLDQKPELP